MERVVETLLALARQEAGLDSPEVEPVELAGLVNAQLERLADAARQRQVTITTRVGGAAWGLADAAACELILAKLLGNAVAHPPATSNIEVQWQATDPGGHMLCSSHAEQEWCEP